VQNRYEFSSTDESSTRYLFKTENGVLYEVLFKPTPYLFDNLPIVNEFVYELIIGKLEGPAQKTARDTAISVTIAAICANFFELQQKRVILFICDSSDGRQVIRARKFRDWFDRFNDSSFIKLDAKIPESTDSYIFLSLIFSLKNPYLHDIVSGFEQIARDHEGPK
jgi:Family of unknown function (DUF6169)